MPPRLAAFLEQPPERPLPLPLLLSLRLLLPLWLLLRCLLPLPLWLSAL